MRHLNFLIRSSSALDYQSSNFLFFFLMASLQLPIVLATIIIFLQCFLGVWGRKLCIQDSFVKFSCLPGDCSPSTLACSSGGGGGRAGPPTTLVEFTLNSTGGLDFYNVSLAHEDGYNLPMAPHGGTGDAQYCCSGVVASPDTCKPSTYSEFFKNACLQAYSYKYEDGTSTFTCTSAHYIITFCPALSARLKLVTDPDTSVETNPCSTAPPSATSVLPRHPRRLLGKLPDVDIHSHPPSTSNKSWDLDKAATDTPSPPAPLIQQPVHE